MPLAVVIETLPLPDKTTQQLSRDTIVAALRIGNVCILFSQREVCVEIGLRIKRELAAPSPTSTRHNGWSGTRQTVIALRCGLGHARREPQERAWAPSRGSRVAAHRMA
jgi:hypothetical protein